MSESESPSPTGVGIPYFFYDIIGRILPGAFLIVGAIITFREHQLISWILDLAQNGIHIETGAATLILGLILTLFVGAAALTGSILASLAHVIDGWLWKLGHKITFENLLLFLNAGDVPSFREHFERHFGKIKPTDEAQFKGASILCSYYILGTSENLGVLAARHDAEALSSQSMVLASLILLIATLMRLCRSHEPLFLYWWLGVLTSVFIGASLTFNYHRKKKIYSRFGLYFASNETQKAAVPNFE